MLIWRVYYKTMALKTKKMKNDALLSRYDIIDGLVQGCSVSIANALEIVQLCTKPSLLCVHILLEYTRASNDFAVNSLRTSNACMRR